MFPGAVATSVSAQLAGANVDVQRNILNTDSFRVNLFYGFQYYDLSESLAVYQATTAVGGLGATVANTPVAPGSTILLTDRVTTRNQFYGGEVGTRLEWYHGLWFLALTPRVGLGPLHQITDIAGQTTTGTTTVPGGLLAVGQNGDGNTGHYETNRFAVATQVGAEAGM